MATRILGKGTRIFDCAGDPRDYALASQRWQVHSAYLGHDFGITPNQIAAIIANGMLIQWNWENHGNEAFGGYNAGVAAVTEAIAIAESFGWKNGESPIIFSGTDVGIPADAFLVCDDFYRACWERTWSGMYGPLAYLFHTTEIDAPDNFVRWHWGGDRPYQDWSYVDVQQIYPRLEPSETGLACPVDDNYQTAKRLTYWAGPGNNPVEETDTMEFRHVDGTVYEMAQGYKWHCSGEYFYGVLGGKLAESGDVSPRGIYAYAVDAGQLAAVADGPLPDGGSHGGTVSGTFQGTVG